MRELEADRLGVLLMIGAGCDPAGALSVWRPMAGDGAAALEWMSTHPADERRLAELEALVGAGQGAIAFCKNVVSSAPQMRRI